ncbi:hypothetical protein MCAPa_8270 [Mycoplasma capricolum subsp. capricolum 14232]|uniref:Uncharacterized protein n=1 Tax=Mycoplasma capricolum subsp. capricolum 14232 TaxID=1188238 RepID=A0A084EGJ0_MYCCA|nr:hypothetical protein MCAPa_8270 [Mycoplasma capricolum subsp. capricolum 14232]
MQPIFFTVQELECIKHNTNRIKMKFIITAIITVVIVKFFLFFKVEKRKIIWYSKDIFCIQK